MIWGRNMFVTAEFPVLGQYSHVKIWDNDSVKINDIDNETEECASRRQH
jgi:hypothetical protein